MNQRYARQIAIPEIGTEGQKKISEAKIFIIGCGALGSMVAMQLAGMGVGTIGIADFDNVELSNLQRQFFYKSSEAGCPKAELMSIRLNELNPEIKIEVYRELITSSIAHEIFPQYDFIIDATDNPESKKMTGEVCKEVKKACCIGGVRNFSGQVMTLLPYDHRIEEYFGYATADGFLPCSLSGVLGSAAALCASIQASETIKFITSTGEILSGKILIFNLLSNSFKTFKI